MKNFIMLMVILGVVLFIYFYSQPKEPEYNPYVYEIIKPEQGRPVRHFDWHNMKYIYQDEIEKWKPTKDFYKQPDYYPDYFVDIRGTSSKPSINNSNYVVVIKGKKYRVNVKVNDDIELIPIR
jgi:hypothetical protein